MSYGFCHRHKHDNCVQLDFHKELYRQFNKLFVIINQFNKNKTNFNILRSLYTLIYTYIYL